MARVKGNVNLFTKFNILINNYHPAFKLPISSKSIKSIVSLVMSREKCVLSELSLNFVNNSEIKRINKKYLNHNYFTDIITFPYNNDIKSIEGEIFISLDTVKKNAELYNSAYNRELKRVIIHGCLHLAGYNDKTKKQQQFMRDKEDYYLNAA